MEFKHTNLPKNPSNDDINNEIKRLEKLKTEHENKNSALKINLNSIYGVAGFKGFICYNKDVAQSVTKQSEDIIKFTIVIFNRFFREVWHELTDVHEKMGITRVDPVKFDVVNYADTDSIFAVLNPVYQSTDYKKSFEDFVLDLNTFVLRQWLADRLEEYVKKYSGIEKKRNGASAFNLTFEEACHSVFWTGKKHYIKNTSLKDGKFFKSLEKVSTKGLQTNKSSTPKFVRDRLKKFVDFIMASEGKVDQKELLKMMRSVRAEFRTVDIADICTLERIGDYEKFVINDKTKLEFASGAKTHIKGAAYYNHLLNKQPQNIKDKYEYIKTASKVQWYYTETGMMETFSFLPGQLPYEYAPPVNVDVQFETVFLSTVNTILKAAKIQPLTSSLMILPGLW